MRTVLSALSLVVVPVMWAVMVANAQVTQDETAAGDAYGYWIAWRGGLYDIPWHGAHAFVYSPPIGLALWPLQFLPWPLFYGLLTAAGMAAVIYMVGLPWAGLTLLIFYPVSHGLAVGNIEVLLAAAIAIGWWWFPLLTKITPGVALAYYLAARQWRRALYAAGVAAVVGVVSMALAVPLWVDWVELARDGLGGTAHPWALLDWPLLVRLPIALAFALGGGWRRWPWTIAVSAMLALPVVWVDAPALLLAIPRLSRPSPRRTGPPRAALASHL